MPAALHPARRAHPLALALPLLGCLLMLGCAHWPGGQADEDEGHPIGVAPDQGTSLGQVGSAGSVNGSVQAPSALNAKASQVKQAAEAQASLCAELRGQIRAAQADERAAPSTSTDEDIVNASLAKGDQRIAQLQQQYDQEGCDSTQLPPAHVRASVPPPAPGTQLP